MNEPLRLAMSAAGETCESLAEKVGVDAKTVGRWLSPGRVPHPRHRRAVARVLQKDAMELFPDRRRDTPWFRPWREVEQEALALRNFQPLVVPGLLQTEAYARALFTGAGLVPRADAESKVKGRLERQLILARPHPPTLTAVVDESVLRRAVGGPAVMRQQMLHLVEVSAECPHVRVHVVPSTAEAYAGLNGPLVLADLKGPRVVAHLDFQLAGHTVSDEADISRLVSSWESCRSEALPYRQSVELIRELAETWN
ncbi:helix-turn-helix domain-containing protein [Micromonospora sonneratiae]|uniref:Scr1 family TA system antitoxin-like transcriptional regulator n=1 Tax=Micromonospora sonneratiae TaxID=1184706 RepID=A0ABW3YIK0_9ACTN